MPVIPLDKLLNSDPGEHLGKIVHIARNMDKLTESLRQSLAPELAQNLVAAATRDDGELVLVGSSSAWAARLRFESDSIMVTAQNYGITATRCRVIVQTSPQL